MNKKYAMALILLLSLTAFMGRPQFTAAVDETPMDKKNLGPMGISGGAEKKKKPAYSLVLLIDVRERNYDDFEAKLPDVIDSFTLPFNGSKEFDFSQSEWDRIKEKSHNYAVVDDIVYPARRRVDKGKYFMFNYERYVDFLKGGKYVDYGPYDHSVKTIEVKHPIVLITWNMSMEGAGRHDDMAFQLHDIFPGFKLTFAFRPEFDPVPLNSPASFDDFATKFVNIRHPAWVWIYSIYADGGVEIFNLDSGRGKLIKPGEQWIASRTEDYNTEYLKDAKYGDFYDTYVKKNKITFRTDTVITNRGFVLMKWPAKK